jgi:hypothetical protein
VLRKSKLSIACTVLVVASAFLPRSASAHGFPGRYADNRDHWSVTVEPTEEQRSYWNHFVHFSLFGQYDPTDLIIHEQSSYTSSVDIYWYSLEQWAFNNDYPGVTVHGDVICEATLSGNACDRFRLRLSEGARATSEANQWHLVCHELGHTIGFDDSVPEPGQGCMSGCGCGVLSTHERGHVNAKF